MNQVRKLWEAPGIAVIAADEQTITVVLFMREATRARWRRSASSARDFRTQQYAPPAVLPEGTIEISIFLLGSQGAHDSAVQVWLNF